MDKSSLPYRENVGIMLVNHEDKVFVGQRIDFKSDAWQMPQGGIDEGETARDAALRELAEETGATEVDIIAESAGWIKYDLPDELIPKLWGGEFRGQKQKWFLARLKGGDELINIATDEPEFHSWQWVDIDALEAIIVPFKKDVYKQVVVEFKPYLGY